LLKINTEEIIINMHSKKYSHPLCGIQFLWSYPDSILELKRGGKVNLFHDSLNMCP
jgi:hypothetical protein